MNFQPVDRLPVWEWAMWWNQTIARWHGEGLPRELYPQFRFVGHFNKLVMHLGEEAIRAEFERLLPLMKRGGFIPSVDHQTPPGVSLEQYRCYLRLLNEYTR